MNSKVLYPRNLRVGDQSGTFILVSKSEYKPDTNGYITTWLTPKGLKVLFLASWNYVGIDRFGRV
jgi:hypothetical protein